MAAASVKAEVNCSTILVVRAAVEPTTGGTPSGPVNREGVRPVKARHPTWLSTGLVIVAVGIVEERTHSVVGEWLTNEQQPVDATAASAEHFAAEVNPPVPHRSTQDAQGYTGVGGVGEGGVTAG